MEFEESEETCPAQQFANKTRVRSAALARTAGAKAPLRAEARATDRCLLRQVAHASACMGTLVPAAARMWRGMAQESHFLFVTFSSLRRLPHVYPAGAWLFVTWHLAGSLPNTRYPPPGTPSWRCFCVDGPISRHHLRRAFVPARSGDRPNRNGRAAARSGDRFFRLGRLGRDAKPRPRTAPAKAACHPGPAMAQGNYRSRGESEARTHRTVLLATGVL